MSRERWIMAAVVFILTLACYWPALRGQPVWDDAAHLTRPELQSTAGLLRIWTDLHATQQFYPVLHSAFWLEHQLWGDHVIGYHLVNVLLHASSSCLFALILMRLWRQAAEADSDGAARRTMPGGDSKSVDSLRRKSGTEADAVNARRRTAGAWFAALLFAVHPVCVESVAWISEQKNTLSLFLYLAASWAYLRFDRTRGLGAYALASACFVLALGTKTVTATLPAALLVIFWWQRGRLSWRREVWPLLPWFTLAVVSGSLTAWIERTLIGAKGAAFDLSLVERALLASRNVWFYAGKLVWPAELMFVYPRWDVAAESSRWSWALLAVVVVTFGLWKLRRRMRGPLAAWLLFLGALTPALGFFNVYPFVFSFVADHFQYHASLAAFALAGAGVAVVLRRATRRLRAVALSLGALATSSLVILANQQSRTYRDSETLYHATLARNPGCWMAHSNLAAELARSPARVPEALEYFAAALRAKPDLAEAHNNLGTTLTTLPGRWSEAVEHFETALRIEPRFGEARLNLANALATRPDRLPEALSQYAETLRQHPSYAEAHFCLANTLANRPETKDAAVSEYRQALALRPDYVEAHENLAGVLALDPETVPEALSHYEKALQLAPDRSHTHYNLAVVLELIPGREAEAMEHYRSAIRHDPHYAAAHNNLGVLHARQAQFDEARAHWERAVALQPGYEDAQRNLERLRQRERRD